MIRRQRLSTKHRLAIFTRAHGICHICEQPIQIGQRWEVSHPIPLELGGPDTDGNRAPAHRRPCHEWQTRMVDLPAIARAKRVRARHVGAFVTRRPLPFGRDDRLRRKVDGTVVSRATGQPWRPRA